MTNPTSNTVNLSCHVRSANFARVQRLQTFKILSDAFVLQKPVSMEALITSDRRHFTDVERIENKGREIRKIRHDVGAKLEIPGKLRKKCVHNLF